MRVCAGENMVQTAQDSAGVICAVRDRLQRNFNHRGDEGGGNAVPGNVGHQDADMFLVGTDEVVKITCYGCHGPIAGADAETLNTGTPLGRIAACIVRAISSSFSTATRRRSLVKTCCTATYPNENRSIPKPR